jgi:mycoredoxin
MHAGTLGFHVGMHEAPLPTAERPDTTITVYWRPGCTFCWFLRRPLAAALEHAGLTGEVDIVEVDIWQDPDAAAFVRSVANGNEVVPTVTVGSEAMVNPSASAVVDAVRAVSPRASR